MAEQLAKDELRQRGRYSLTVAALFVLILVGGGLPLPRRGVVVVPIALTIVVSVREMRRLSRESASAFTRFGPVVALGLCAVLLLGAVTQAIFYAPQKRYEDCMTGANTNAAQAVCGQQRQQSIVGSLTDF